MKINFLSLLVLILCGMSCTKDTVTERYTFYKPVYATRDQVRNSIGTQNPRAFEATSKLVYWNDMIFLVENDKGVHVIDYTNSNNPVNRSFIYIPGCRDIAIHQATLYADCYTDLVAMDISNPTQATLKSFVRGAFPHRIYNNTYFDTSNIIIDWVRVDTVIKSNIKNMMRNEYNQQVIFYNPWLSSSMPTSATGATPNTRGGSAKAGSMARFGLYNNRLYTVSNSDLKVFNVTQPNQPAFVRTLSLGAGDIETIFPYRTQLFIGSSTGVHIYDATNPDQPTRLSLFTHARACDPVIADGDYAYVTLKGGGICGGNSNQMDIINIQDLTAPRLIQSIGLTGPSGLGKNGNQLWVCDATSGVRVFDAANPANPIEKQVLPALQQAYDVIVLADRTFVSTSNNLYCCSINNSWQVSVLSNLRIKP
ncbi:MAG: LVIVD repeat-containing protein [Chitinophagaceae bacterium]